MKSFLQRWRDGFAHFLTLRRRMTLWTGGLLLVLGLVLVLIFNMLTVARVPQAVSVVVLQATPESAYQFPLTPSPDQSLSLPPEEVVVEPVRKIVAREVRWISVIGVVVFALLGAAGAYWITRQGLRPVRQLSQAVQEIQADSLDRRVALTGPPDEVKALADAFDHMLERLQQAFEQQSRFVADAAHELRTPLTTLRTHLEVIQGDPSAALSDYREMAQTMDRTLSRMERLVEDLLLLARGEMEIRREIVPLEVLLTEVMNEMRPLAQACEVALKLDVVGEPAVLADPPLLARAVSNLVENGIRYNRPGGSVIVTAYPEGGGFAIQVRDTGIGIPPEELPHIFERFYRVDRSRDRHRGGAGLGLSIAAHIVRLHGGHIQVKSQPGTGSIFTIWLPAANAEREPSNLTGI